MKFWNVTLTKSNVGFVQFFFQEFPERADVLAQLNKTHENYVKWGEDKEDIESVQDAISMLEVLDTYPVNYGDIAPGGAYGRPMFPFYLRVALELPVANVKEVH